MLEACKESIWLACLVGDLGISLHIVELSWVYSRYVVLSLIKGTLAFKWEVVGVVKPNVPVPNM